MAAAPPAASASPATDKPEEFDKMYYVVYGFTFVIAAVGLLGFTEPSWDMPIDSAAIIVVVLFLLTKGDLLVDYIRLRKELERFKENNRAFKKTLNKEKVDIVKCRKAAKEYSKIQHCLDADVKELQKVVDTLKPIAVDQIEHKARKLLERYVAEHILQAGVHFIRQGEHLSQAIGVLRLLTAHAHGQFEERIAAMVEALEASPRFQKGVRTETGKCAGLVATELAKCYADVMLCDTIDDVPGLVKDIMQRVDNFTAVEEDEEDEETTTPGAAPVPGPAAAET